MTTVSQIIEETITVYSNPLTSCFQSNLVITRVDTKCYCGSSHNEDKLPVIIQMTVIMNELHGHEIMSVLKCSKKYVRDIGCKSICVPQ